MTRALRVGRLISAIEGECDGLAVTTAQAEAILNFVDCNLLPAACHSAKE